MGSVVNPIQQVHDLLWQVLEQHQGWTDLVRIGNRVNYLEGTFPKSSETSSADLPEVGIVPVGSRPTLNKASNRVAMVKLFSIVTVTGKSTLLRLFEIEFAAFAAMADFQPLCTALEWRGYNFCTHMLLTDITDSMLEDRGISGWSSVWGCEVHMNFPLTTLREN